MIAVISEPEPAVTTAAMTRAAVMIVSDAAGVVGPEILSRSRGPFEAALARQLAVYLVHCVGGVSMETTARAFRRDRSSVSNALAVVEDLRDVGAFDDLVERLSRRFEAALAMSAARPAAGAWDAALHAVRDALDNGDLEGTVVGVALRADLALGRRMAKGTPQ